MKRLALLTLTGLMAISACQAAVIYSALPNQSGGSDMNGFLQADDFVIAGPTALTQIKFWTFQSSESDYAGSVEWTIYNDAPGEPGSVISTGSATPTGVATGNSAFGFSEYSYTMPVLVNLNPGTYWLSLHNGPSGTIPATDFYWGWSSGDGGSSVSMDLSFAEQPWVQNFAELAFELDGREVTSEIPEPSSVALLGAGLFGLWSLRKRKAQ
jgi:hypothetical protein